MKTRDYVLVFVVVLVASALGATFSNWMQSKRFAPAPAMEVEYAEAKPMSGADFDETPNECVGRDLDDDCKPEGSQIVVSEYQFSVSQDRNISVGDNSIGYDTHSTFRTLEEVMETEDKNNKIIASSKDVVVFLSDYSNDPCGGGISIVVCYQNEEVISRTSLYADTDYEISYHNMKLSLKNKTLTVSLEGNQLFKGKVY